jgi:hypothetical protein
MNSLPVPREREGLTETFMPPAIGISMPLDPSCTLQTHVDFVDERLEIKCRKKSMASPLFVARGMDYSCCFPNYLAALLCA